MLRAKIGPRREVASARPKEDMLVVDLKSDIAIIQGTKFVFWRQ